MIYMVDSDVNIYRNGEIYEKRGYQKKYQEMYANEGVDYKKNLQIGWNAPCPVATEQSPQALKRLLRERIRHRDDPVERLQTLESDAQEVEKDCENSPEKRKRECFSVTRITGNPREGSP